MNICINIYTQEKEKFDTRGDKLGPPTRKRSTAKEKRVSRGEKEKDKRQREKKLRGLFKRQRDILGKLIIIYT